MNNRQAKRRKEAGECSRQEGVSVSDRRLSFWFAGIFVFLSGGCIAARGSVGRCCSGVAAGRCWLTGQNTAFFCRWLKKCNKRVEGHGGHTPSPPLAQRATAHRSQGGHVSSKCNKCIESIRGTVTEVHFQQNTGKLKHRKILLLSSDKTIMIGKNSVEKPETS